MRLLPIIARIWFVCLVLDWRQTRFRLAEGVIGSALSGKPLVQIDPKPAGKSDVIKNKKRELYWSDSLLLLSKPSLQAGFHSGRTLCQCIDYAIFFSESCSQVTHKAAGGRVVSMNESRSRV